MTSYIIAGVKADNENVFMQRVGELLERNNLLDQLTEGIVLTAYINDPEKCLAKVSQRNKSWNITKLNGCEIDSDNRIRVKYDYSKECWFKSEEDAEKGSKGWGVYTSDEQKETYPVKGIYCGSSSDTFNKEQASEYGIELEVL